MNLLNETKFAGGYAPGRLKSGRDCLVLVAKATYSLPVGEGEKPTLLAEQIEPSPVDIPLGDPESTPILYEHDYVPYKPNCDVILIGSAYAPPQDSRQRVAVRMTVGSMIKTFVVVGHRQWQKKNGMLYPGEPVPFTCLPIHYGVAYGGMGMLSRKQKMYAYADNMLGVGYYGNQSNEEWLHKPLPNTEEVESLIKKPTANYIPMSFGPIAKNSPARIQYAGTYDNVWEQQKAPFLPDDFDERFYQCAPGDQQIPYLQGGETVVLNNLTPENFNKFILPKEKLMMHVVYQNDARVDLESVIDTLIFEPDKQRFSVVWRAMVPLKRNMREVDTMIIGVPTRAWERARLMGKTYVPMSKLKEYRHILRG